MDGENIENDTKTRVWTENINFIRFRGKNSVFKFIRISVDDQRSGNATALDDSNTGTRNFWFRFDSARASKIVVEMNKFQQPMRFCRLFGGLSV